MYIALISLDFSAPIGYTEIQTTGDQFCGPYTSIEEAVKTLAEKGLDLGGFVVSRDPDFEDKGCSAAHGYAPNTKFRVSGYWVRIVELTQPVHPGKFSGYQEQDYIRTISPAS